MDLTAKILVTIVAHLVLALMTGVFVFLLVSVFNLLLMAIGMAKRRRDYGEIAFGTVALLIWVVGFGGIIHGFLRCTQSNL